MKSLHTLPFNCSLHMSWLIHFVKNRARTAAMTCFIQMYHTPLAGTLSGCATADVNKHLFPYNFQELLPSYLS